MSNKTFRRVKWQKHDELPEAGINMACAKWNSGRDTYDIAKEMGISEADVYNGLAKIFRFRDKARDAA